MKKTVLFAMLAGISWAQISSPMKIGKLNFKKITKGLSGITGLKELPKRAQALFQSISREQANSKQAFLRLKSNLQQLRGTETAVAEKIQASNDILGNLVTLSQNNEVVTSAFKSFLDAVAKVTGSVSAKAAGRLRTSGNALKDYASRLHKNTQLIQIEIGKVLNQLQLQ